MLSSERADGLAITTGVTATAAGRCEYHQYPPPAPPTSRMTMVAHRDERFFCAGRVGMGRAAARTAGTGACGARGGVMGLGVMRFCATAAAAAAAGAASEDPIRLVRAPSSGAEPI